MFAFAPQVCEVTVQPDPLAPGHLLKTLKDLHELPEGRSLGVELTEVE